MNNLQQCENYKNLIKERIDNYIDSLGLDMTKDLFMLQNRKVTPVVNKGLIYCDFNAIHLPDFGKRPSSKKVEEVKKRHDDFMGKDMDKTELRVQLHSGSCSWMDDLEKYQSGIYSTNKSKLEDLAKVQEVEYQRVYVAKDGQFNCNYCQKATDNKSKVKKEIIFRTRNSWGKACIGTKTNDYCSSQCGGYDQMGHEG